MTLALLIICVVAVNIFRKRPFGDWNCNTVHTGNLGLFYAS